MPPWFQPWFYPMGMGMDQKKEDDPFKMMKKWRKFLMTEDQKKKEKEKKPELWEQVNQISLFLLATMIIAGPLTLLVLHIIKNSVQ